MSCWLPKLTKNQLTKYKSQDPSEVYIVFVETAKILGNTFRWFWFVPGVKLILINKNELAQKSSNNVLKTENEKGILKNEKDN